MSADGQRTKWLRNIAENFNHLTDDRTTDGRTTTYSERDTNRKLICDFLLVIKQFGFLKGRSTALQLLNIIDEWTLSLDSGGQIDCIYIWTLKRPSIKFLIND